ncbi:hypothetical protein R50073_07960 [Maricurvus nonylphenolicus]|uniref:DUF2971 domain-containing protein n=1 Tax=Maricurvus nonylphenolicus TaxID=1008307 RepID=UPI0036F39B70
MAAHTPETLVKYCTADTAQKILSSQTLRWSAPHQYSDPFELTHETQLNFDPHVLLQAAIKMASAMIFGKDAPRGGTPLMAAIRRWRDEERFASPEEAEDVLRELLSQVVDQRQAILDQVMTDWRKFARTLRICSFSAKPDNLSAWQNFSDNHRGVAIRFQSGEFTALPKPRKVEYSTVRPEITTLKEQMSAVMNSERVVPQEHFFEKFTCKPATSAGEQEWRCFQQIKEDLNATSGGDQVWHNDIKFERSEITAVYFGAFTPIKIKREIFDLVKEKYSQAKIFQAKAVSGKYEIEFERITKR